MSVRDCVIWAHSCFNSIAQKLMKVKINLKKKKEETSENVHSSIFTSGSTHSTGKRNSNIIVTKSEIRFLD